MAIEDQNNRQEVRRVKQRSKTHHDRPAHQRKVSDMQRVEEHFSGLSLDDIYADLCKNLLKKTPQSHRQAKRWLKRVFINIFDYVDGNYDKTYRHRYQLQQRCRKRGFYSKDKAKNDNLRALLHVLF
eukprot:m.14725 g.14725  ORF g.14725 m.14725 type:complete len:127 (-) comp9285_c0_seq1:46-426(-)